ncbi:aminopeptidase N [Brevundimonas nasdae]|uniref:M1 family metallopeptidase n=1 Tax=Brevundimonas nasdae TaxID=172043 RepID=UPI001914AB76|nr:M1 family metallopeptidase [Brevundimonas nasdae]MBK6025266.1 M1 family metallopeptidase [Brevundimonas nasdae]MDQ0451952.1 aminopeptidase N [Brevundimonas nasdae]
MKRKAFGLVSALALAAALGVSACSTTTGGASMTPPAIAPAPGPQAVDSHTYGRPEIARVVDVALDLTANFQAKTLSGTATLDLLTAPNAGEVILDIRNLDIQSVSDAAGQPLRFDIGPDDAIKGQPLTVHFPAAEGDGRRKIIVRYSTRPDAAALQWLTPAQTAGGQKPYLFSQGQAILTRTWVPTQDSPGIRQTYSARITAPADLTVVMSADHLTPEGEAAPNGQKTWRFRMNNPIPPYLIALGVGELAFAPFDNRTGVWTEPSRLAAAQWELEPTAAMVTAAEKLYGPYRWGRYDLLVLPPSFPFGGMENPKLTFATPTIIAGDRSLVSLVAHELAHSWSGNLVTNATWNDFWLNEGFTSYFENRIMESVYGHDLAVQEQVLAWDGLQDELKSLPADDTKLHLNLTGRDPDDGMNTIAYDKGAAFLRTIEGIAGREKFDAWMRGYFDRNAYRPMTTAMFLDDIRAHLVKGDARLETALKLDEWVYQPGLPSNAVAPVSHAFEPVDVAAVAFFQNKGPASAIPWSGWNTQQRQRFLSWRPQGLAANADWLTDAQLGDLQSTLNLANEGNSELIFAWLQIALAHRYQPSVVTAEKFLTSQGRRKFVLPLFQTLWNEGDWGRAQARRIYAEARPLYHPVTAGSVDALVGRP